MSIETALVVWKDGTTTVHEPEGRSSVRIPDTQSLWDILFDGKDRIEGVAHTHPGRGYTSPSREDLTTFAAVEKGIGRRIKWWILTSNHSVLLEWTGHGLTGYELKRAFLSEEEPPWMNELRALSFPGMTGP